jgi:hypothetical protein
LAVVDVREKAIRYRLAPGEFFLITLHLAIDLYQEKVSQSLIFIGY